MPTLDALRGVAILAVVALHVSYAFLRVAPLPSQAGAILLAIHLLTGFAVPLFVALSMASLSFGRRDAGGSLRAYGAFLAARARRILPPYVFWSTVMLLREDPGKLLHPMTYTHLLIVGGIKFHLYFVPLICALYLLWPLLQRLGRIASRSVGAALVLGVAGMAGSIGWWRLAAAGLIPNVTLALVPFWLGYAVLGLAVAPWLRTALTHSRTSRTPLIVAAALTTVAAVAWFHHVHGMLVRAPAGLTFAVTIFQIPSAFYAVTAMALVLIAVARLEGTMLHRALARLGRDSYGIYLVHVLALEQVVFRVVSGPDATTFTGGAWVAKLLFVWVTCLALSDALVRLVAASPPLRAIAGVAPDEVPSQARSEWR